MSAHLVRISNELGSGSLALTLASYGIQVAQEKQISQKYKSITPIISLLFMDFQMGKSRKSNEIIVVIDLYFCEICFSCATLLP